MHIELLIALTSYSSRELQAHIVMTTKSELIAEAIKEIDNSWYYFQGSLESFIQSHNLSSEISKIDFKKGVIVLQGC
jgi:hypothetical protein